MANQYTPTRYGVIIKNTVNPTHIIGAHLDGHTIVIEFYDGYTRDDVETLVRAWYPTATGVTIAHTHNGGNETMLQNERGQTIVDYIIMLGLAVVVIIIGLSILAPALGEMLPNMLGL